MGDSGICGAIRFSISRSMTLKAVLSNVMGLYEVTSVGSLLGLRIVITMPCFQGRARFGAAVWALDISAPDIRAPGLSGARTFFSD